MVRGRSAVLMGVLVILLASAAGAFAEERGMGLRPLSPEQLAALRGLTPPVTQVAPNALSRARAQEEAARLGVAAAGPMPRPSSVDNSARSAFPPITSQGSQSSCSAFSTAYYYNTYTQALDEGYAASGGSSGVLCSPAFIYSLENGGDDSGASIELSLIDMGQFGCATLTDAPWSPYDSTTWPSETAWVNGLRNRLGPWQYFDFETDPATSFAALKQHLANGQLAVLAVSVYHSWYDDSVLPDDAGVSNGVWYAASGSIVGGHALTLVGYDDSKSYVDSRDGQTHYGAFLVANSWGQNWGVTNTANRRGFMWIAYEYLLQPGANLWWSGDTLVSFTSDRPHYRPALYAVVGLNHAERDKLLLSGTVSGTTSWESECVLGNSYWGIGYGGAYPVDDTKRIAVDLTDGLGNMRGGSASTAAVRLEVLNTASSNATITSADFYADAGGDGSYIHTAAAGLPVTVTPDSSGSASSSINPLGIEYQLLGMDLPVGLAWDTYQVCSADILNQSPITWTTDYGLRARDGLNRWGLLSTPLGESLPGDYATPVFTLVAPPVSTLAYTAPVDLTKAPVPDTLPVDLLPVHDGTPLVGTPSSAGVAVARFADTLPTTAGAWASGEIQECAGNVPLIIAGYQDGTFRPASTLTRAQLAAFLQRALKLYLPSDPAEYHLTFGDMNATTRFWGEIQALIDSGIVKGYASDNTYRPDWPVNRGQMAQFLVRGYLGAPVPDYLGIPHFWDVSADYTFYDAIEYGFTHGLIKGYNDNSYRAENLVNRGQIAAFLYRAFLQGRPSVVVLGGPAITAQNPATGGRCGWASAASGAAANPGFAYVSFDAVRMETSLAYGGAWEVTFELRTAAAPNTPATGAYLTTVSTSAADLGTAITSARASGSPYFTLAWDIPAGLAPGDYVLVVRTEDATGAMTEVARRVSFTIAP